MSISAKAYDLVRTKSGIVGAIIDVSQKEDSTIFTIEVDGLDPKVPLVYASPDEIEEVIRSN